jgi:hypothetical protein
MNIFICWAFRKDLSLAAQKKSETGRSTKPHHRTAGIEKGRGG